MLPVDANVWPIVSPLLDRALDLDVDARRQFVDEVLASDPRTGAVLSALIDAHDNLSTSDFLETPPRLLADPTLAGTTVGSYTLETPVGAGGTGVVWRARRSDGRFEGAVAVKLLQLSALSESSAARFTREGTLLARLSHENVARLFDAGVTPAGQPYLVLELIEGSRIDQYAEAHKLSVDARLRLFLQVCDAVAHAHAHLVVHLDLKPSNILVDHRGLVKLLDFGVAALMAPDGVDGAARPAAQGFTPEFAAPEQLRGEPVTTATDVYALGTILPRLLGDTATGDLDAITRKAISQEAERRYATASLLADDIRRYLRHEPVTARPSRWTYRAGKFARRHRVAVAVALLVSIGAATALYIVNRERALAEYRFLQVRQLAHELLNIDATVRELPGSARTRQMIVNAALTYLQNVMVDAESDPALSLELGNAFMRVARVQGVPVTVHLGQSDEAERNLQTAERLVSNALRQQPANTMALLRMAQITHDRMILAGQRRPDTEALPLARQSAEWLDRLLATSPALDEDALEQVFIVLNNVGGRFRLAGEFDRASELVHRGIALASQQTTLNARLHGGALLIGLSRIHRDRGDLEAALVAIREAQQHVGPPPGDSVGRVASFALMLSTEGQLLSQRRGVSLNRPAEAIGPLQRGFDFLDSLVHRDSAEADTRFRLGSIALLLADALAVTEPARALEVHDHSLRHLGEIEATNPRVPREQIRALAYSTRVLNGLGRLDEADRRLTKAFDQLRAIKSYPSDKVDFGSETDAALSALADDHVVHGRISDAIATYQELLDKTTAAGLELENNLNDASDWSTTVSTLAILHKQAGEHVRARVLSEQRDALWTRWDKKAPGNPVVARQAWR